MLTPPALKLRTDRHSPCIALRSFSEEVGSDRATRGGSTEDSSLNVGQSSFTKVSEDTVANIASLLRSLGVGEENFVGSNLWVFY